jgi:hypothetical protein
MSRVSELLVDIFGELVLLFLLPEVVALYLGSRLFRVRVPILRILAIAAVGMVAVLVGDVLASALSLRGIGRQALQEVVHAVVVAGVLARATEASVAKAGAIAVATGLTRLLLLLLAEGLWMAYVYGTATA